MYILKQQHHVAFSVLVLRTFCQIYPKIFQIFDAIANDILKDLNFPLFVTCMCLIFAFWSVFSNLAVLTFSSFFVDSNRYFYIDDHIVCKSRHTLASSFFQSLCFLFLALSHWLEPPVAMSERTDESTRPSVASDLRRKVVTLSQFRMISAVDFFHLLFIRLKKFPSIIILMRVFIKSRCELCQKFYWID